MPTDELPEIPVSVATATLFASTITAEPSHAARIGGILEGSGVPGDAQYQLVLTARLVPMDDSE